MHHGYIHYGNMHYGYMHLDMVDMDMPSALGLVRIDVCIFFCCFNPIFKKIIFLLNVVEPLKCSVQVILRRNVSGLRDENGKWELIEEREII